MKKIVILFFLALVLLSLVGCVGAEFIDLSTFTERWNMISDEKVDYSCYTISEDENQTVYSMVKDGTAIRLVNDENGKLKQCKVIVAKKDSTGNDISLTEEINKAFYELCKKSIMSFCDFEEDETVVLLNEFQLGDINSLKQKGELTKNKYHYNFVYYSAEPASELIITNCLLEEIESTLKPESKIAFADTTQTRVETVPHD